MFFIVLTQFFNLHSSMHWRFYDWMNGHWPTTEYSSRNERFLASLERRTPPSRWRILGVTCSETLKNRSWLFWCGCYTLHCIANARALFSHIKTALFFAFSLFSSKVKLVKKRSVSFCLHCESVQPCLTGREKAAFTGIHRWREGERK